MVIKWKNMIKRMGRFLKNYRKLIFGILFMLPGLFVFFVIIAYRWSHPTEEALFFGVIANVLSGMGIVQISGFYLQRKYAGWIPLKEDFYSEWRIQWRKQQIILGVAGIGAGIAACWYFTYMKYSSYWTLNNYASGYIMFGTVLIQYGVCQMTVIRFMKGRLHMLMERMSEINRESLENALEIEKKSLEKVSRSDQLRVDLITNVSHDLKTPLTSMVGYIELMKKEDLSDIAKDYLEVISDKAGKLKEMIESLFSLAKASSGNIEFHMESIELNRLIEQIFADMEDRVKASGLQFVTQLTQEDTAMMTDNMHLYRICQNLMENALKYSAKGTRVFVKTYIEEKVKLCLEITNTAGYLMNFQKEDIVERFARADQARTSEGNGLGLAIVSTYTKALGGEFDIFIDCDQFRTKLTFPKKIEK